MKIKTTLTSLLVGLFICLGNAAQAQTSYALEQKILDCFYRNHEANHIDVRKTITGLETIFVKHKILDDRSGKSYLRLVEKIKNGDNVNVSEPSLYTDIESLGYIPMTVFCKDTNSVKFGPKEIENSKLKYILGIYDSLQVADNVSNAIIAGELLKFITASDLEHDFYRSLELLVITNLIMANREMESDPTSMSGEVKVESRTNNSYVLLVKKDKVVAQGKAIALTELRASIKKFVTETSDQTEVALPTVGKQKTSAGIIFIQKEKDTPAAFYKKVQSELAGAYMDIRNSNSVRLFKKKFNSLDKKKKQIIMDLVPEKISEGK